MVMRCSSGMGVSRWLRLGGLVAFAGCPAQNTPHNMCPRKCPALQSRREWCGRCQAPLTLSALEIRPSIDPSLDPSPSRASTRRGGRGGGGGHPFKLR